MNKTRKIEITVELIRIVAAVAIAYAIALLTLVVFSDEPVYIIQQFILGPFSSMRRLGSVINLAIPFTFTGLCFCFMYAVTSSTSQAREHSWYPAASQLSLRSRSAIHFRR